MNQPHDSAAYDLRLASVLAELTDRLQRGEHVDLDEIQRSHPDLAADLGELWGAVLVADVAGSESVVLENEKTSTAPSFESSFDLPCEFADYVLEEEVGRGGMGIVFRARQTSLDREVAVKMILSGTFATKSERERFRAEAEAAARLDHPNIVAVHEVGEHGEIPYFSLRYIAGMTLAERLRMKPMPARDAAEILAKVARAVDCAHQCGVLHRDLKPSNILLDEAGEPYVTDFGLAKRDNDANVTRTGAVIGTPAYMSPEQASGNRNAIGPASDIYGLGAILYYMLTGRPPFQADSPVDVLLLVREQDPIRPRIVNPRADRDLEMIALRCLQKPSDLRYRSAAMLADDLEAYLVDEPLAVRSGRLVQVLSRAFRETHHATVLENWGLLWMWHSLVLLGVCLLTNGMQWLGTAQRWHYVVLWTLALWAWGGVFWLLRRRMGPVTFVERQIAHVWLASLVGIAALFPLEWYLQLETLTLSPIIGVVGAMTFIIKGGILSGLFYAQGVALLCTSVAMLLVPEYAHAIFGFVSAACFFFPGLKYHRQRLRNVAKT
ncbi:MAG TPA: serine/threonine protein kinase [Planctomycetes bacterium]|nr:serine/threonine protein kinase [Planctomycetota bacterium]